MLFFKIGAIIQEYARKKSKKSVQSLIELMPNKASVLDGGKAVEMFVESVHKDDIIIVKPGERVPLDGIVIEGKSELDISSLTGEKIPQFIEEGSTILTSSLNLNSAFKMRVTNEFYESTKTFQKVIDSTSNKAQAEKFITKFAKIYTPLVAIAAILVALIPPIIFPDQDLMIWARRALVFLVISCPCALVLSIPLAFLGGVGLSSRYGILVKGGDHLEDLNKISTVCFDKTGTLTNGSYSVVKIKTNEIEEDEFIRIAATIENSSNHPIAVAIQTYNNQIIDLSNILSIEEIPGQGVKAQYLDKEILLGRNILLKNNNIKFDEEELYDTVVYMAINGEYQGFIALSDTIRSDSKKTIDELKKIGVKKIAILTGDKKNISIKVAKELGIEEVCYELLPNEKIEKIESLKALMEGKLMFVGDGLNDAPVLSISDIGVAMGGIGADASVDIADIVIIGDEPSKIITAIKIAKATKKILYENIIVAIFVKILALVLGAFGIINMSAAFLADFLVSIWALLNSLNLSNKKIN